MGCGSSTETHPQSVSKKGRGGGGNHGYVHSHQQRRQPPMPTRQHMYGGEPNTKPSTGDKPETEETRYHRYRPPVREPSPEPIKEYELVSQDNTKNYLGVNVKVIDTRQNKTSESMERPQVADGELYTDYQYSLQTALEDLGKDLEWKRPNEVVSDPCLFSEGTSRFDIGQGAAGTCWFLSILSALAERPDVLKQIIPEDAYPVGTSDYKGVFHCKFWKFGEWLDIYIDDFLPVIYGTTFWGAKSATDPNELWVSLMEKAFSRFQGSYRAAWGGWAGAAFIYMTGGVAEKVDLDEVTPQQVYKRMKNALLSGAVVACSVPQEHEGSYGLVGKHAYTVTGAAKVPYQGQMVCLVRVRNPWGTEKGEWKGAWGDNDTNWSEVSETERENLNAKGTADGEFWISLDDYCTYFSDTHICNFTPDVDQDGKPDGLMELTCIFGEWKGRTAAGCGEKKFNNPKYSFTVPSSGQQEDGLVPVVIQFIQYQEDRQAKDHYFIRCDLYKVESKETDGQSKYILDQLTNFEKYWGGEDVTYRYRLEPGDYVLLPTTLDEGKERQFLLRIFSTVAVENACEVADSVTVFIRAGEKVLICDDQTFALNNGCHWFGAWKAGSNAGGQVSCRDTYAKNPQYLITVPGSEPQPMDISLMQEWVGDVLPIGVKIYKVEPGDDLPLSIDTLYERHSDCPKTITGKNIFIFSDEADGQFLLDPGQYVLLLFTEKPDVERSIAVAIWSQDSLEFTAYNE